MSRETPEQVLQSIVEGINAGNLDALMSLYEPEAAFASQPGSLAHGPAGVRESLTAFLAMKGRLDLKVTRVLEAGGLALVAGAWAGAGDGRMAKTAKSSRTARPPVRPSAALHSLRLMKLSSRRDHTVHAEILGDPLHFQQPTTGG